MNGFLLHNPAQAGWNMSVDNWLAEQAPLAPGEIIVRLYQWSRGAISVGRNQLWQKALHLPSLPAGQVAVRRITGGRAIYHDESELTYSIVLGLGTKAPSADTNKQGQASTIDTLTNEALTIDKPLIRETSLKVSRALVEFLRRLSMAARIERGRTVSRNNESVEKNDLTRACFESVSRHEITAAGQKIVAGAQRIIGTRYFQHGSIKIAGIEPHPALFSVTRGVSGGMNRAAKFTQSGNKSAPRSCYSRQEIAPCPHSMAPAFKAAFEKIFGCTLPEISLTEADKAAINDRQSELDIIMGLPDSSKSANLLLGYGEAGPPHTGAGRAHRAGSLTRNALTEKRIECDREVGSRSEMAMRVARNRTLINGGSVGLALKP